MNRVMRMGIGLLALIPVLGIVGWLIASVDIDGRAGTWVTLGAAFAWIVLMIWWALRAPAQLTEKYRNRYLAFLRHPEYEPLDRADADATRDRR